MISDHSLKGLVHHSGSLSPPRSYNTYNRYHTIHKSRKEESLALADHSQPPITTLDTREACRESLFCHYYTLSELEDTSTDIRTKTCHLHPTITNTRAHSGLIEGGAH